MKKSTDKTTQKVPVSLKNVETSSEDESMDDIDEEEEEEEVTSVSKKNTKSGSGSKSATLKQPPVKKPIFQYTAHHRESHDQALFGIASNHFVTNKRLFATVGSNRMTIYECPDLIEYSDPVKNKKQVAIKLLKCYSDPDLEEIFYTCSWSYNKRGQQLIAIAGLRALIRIINTNCMESETNLIGHTQAINELKFHPKEPNLLLSASKDHSLRLWNVAGDRSSCVAIFGGVEGHRDEVLSADFDCNGRFIVSSGMDHSLKLWQCDDDEIYEKIKSNRRNDVFKQHFPNYHTRDIHRNYVDCVRCFGNFILSKSCEDSVVCWKPGKPEDTELKPNENASTIIHHFDFKDCEIWFIKFDVDFNNRFLAVGNQSGKTYVWNLDVEDPTMAKQSVLTHPKLNAVVRQTAFSKDSQVLMTVADDGTVWRWDLREDN